MRQLPTRSSLAWIVAAHTLAAGALGGLEAARLGASVGCTIVPVFAVTGLLIGCVIALAEHIAPRTAWWRTAAVLALPSVAITIPMSLTLYDGAYARTLPLAQALPWGTPAVLWIATATAIAIGSKLAGDRIGRSIAILGLAGAIGAIVWIERHVLGAGYPGAHVAATLAILVLAGATLRLIYRGRLSSSVAAVIAALALGTGVAAMMYGLGAMTDRLRLSAQGDQSRDLVRMWRQGLDLDRDGSSALLGGGDCDDADPAIHPGAKDVPGDGIDQDCDDHDAAPPPAPAPAPEAPPPAQAAPPHAQGFEAGRRSYDAAALLERTRTMTIVLVTVDALRFDLLAPGAPYRDDFPRLGKLLDDSVWFTHAIAPASGTDISLSTLLTGRFDPYQQVATTLPEALRGAGRRTYSAIPGEVTRYVGDVLIGRGVDHPTTVQTDWAEADIGDHVSAGATTAAGLRALADADGAPAFVWLHYFDVHEHHQIKVTPAMLAAVHDTGGAGGPAAHAYRALLAQIDREVGRLLDELSARGLAESTIVVFASDHGEALGGDPRLGDTHGRFAYAPLVRIPLAFRIPGVAPGQRTDSVSLVDIAPTVLALAGVPEAIRPLDGVDLVSALLAAPAGRTPRDRAIVIHEELQWSVVEWPFQLLVKPADNIVELYQLERDPAERDDLARAMPDVVARLKARFAEVPDVRVDRTPAGRAWREQRAQPPQRHAMP